MQVMRRTVVALGAAAAILALAGCGGLGVNIGSGTSRGSQVVNRVLIQVQSGINLPQVNRGHTLLMQAVAEDVQGGIPYVSSTQGAVWSVINAPRGCGPGLLYSCTTSASFTGIIVLLNGDCATPYAGTVTQTVCVFGAAPGTSGLNATVSGVTGMVTVTTL